MQVEHEHELAKLGAVSEAEAEPPASEAEEEPAADGGGVKEVVQ